MITHKQLVESAYKWVLKNASCGVAFKEFSSLANNGEQPDVIGFGAWNHSVLIECKVTRSDFLADKKKRFRINPEYGMGKIRYYCCPKDLIKESELPSGWGLIYVDENLKCRKVFQPKSEMIKYAGHYEDYKFNQNISAEHSLMYSALRRLQIRGLVKMIYKQI